MSNLDCLERVSVEKVANVYYNGRTYSRTVWCEDGSKRILGIILPTDDVVTEYKFETESSERIEILMGECEVKLPDSDEYVFYRAGQAFFVQGHSHYVIKNESIVQYICKFEG